MFLLYFNGLLFEENNQLFNAKWSFYEMEFYFLQYRFQLFFKPFDESNLLFLYVRTQIIAKICSNLRRRLELILYSFFII